MLRLSDRLEGLSSSLTLDMTARANALKKKGIEIVNFAAGEPDFPTPPFIRQATVRALEEGFTRYTPSTGIPELKEAIVDKFKRDNQISYTPSQIVVSCGAKHSLYNLLQVLCNKGDEVLFGSPYWVSYPELVRLAGGIPVMAPTEANHSFRLTRKEIERHWTPKTKVLILNSPANPTGSVYDKKELEEIADLALLRNLFVISDEIYEKLIFDGKKHYAIASFGKEIMERTATVNGVSKAYAMTGFRIGYCGAPLEIAEAVGKLQSHSTSNPTSLSQKAALAALTGDQSDVTQMAREFEKRRDRLYNGLKDLQGLKPIRPEGAFYIFCDVSSFGLSSSELANRFLDEARVATIPGEGFGMEGYLRFSFATSQEKIDEGLRNIAQWVKQFDRH
ncbi:MAG: pyridoxal phosphate-dependent aminotransferase [Candidatus Omnitrophica bacterium]|nr:pyridoxal phosphate-dependent aminotransferase [Candidatus Omnitrophota bacterium]